VVIRGSALAITLLALGAALPAAASHRSRARSAALSLGYRGNALSFSLGLGYGSFRGFQYGGAYGGYGGACLPFGGYYGGIGSPWGYGGFSPFLQYGTAGMPYGWSYGSPIQVHPPPVVVLDLPPRVTYAAPPPETPRRPAAREPAGPEGRAGERYYLQPPAPRSPEPRSPRSLLDELKERLGVHQAEEGVYLLRWRGAPDETTLVEFRSVDEKGQTLDTRRITAAPFRGLLRVPENAAAVHVTVEARSGASVSAKLPAAELRALERK